MPYGDFKSTEEIETKFAVSIDSAGSLFRSVEEVPPGSRFVELFQDNIDLALNVNTEKTRSEFIIAPFLMELRRILGKKISLFSGTEFKRIGKTKFFRYVLTDKYISRAR